MSAVLEFADSGRVSMSGPLTFESAPQLWRDLERQPLGAEPLSVDLSRVSEVDSAGLALLVAWKAQQKAVGRDLNFSAAPAQLIALAQLTSAEALFR